MSQTRSSFKQAQVHIFCLCFSKRHQDHITNGVLLDFLFTKIIVINCLTNAANDLQYTAAYYNSDKIIVHIYKLMPNHSTHLSMLCSNRNVKSCPWARSFGPEKRISINWLNTKIGL